MTWAPRNTKTRAEHLEQHADDSLKPVLRMPLRVSLAIFGVLATLVIIGLLLVIAASAGATTIRTADASDASSYETAVQRSFMATPPGQVTVDPSGCPSHGGSGCALERTIWLHPHDPATEPYTGAFMHELGHVADYVVQQHFGGTTAPDNPYRLEFLQAMDMFSPWDRATREGEPAPMEAWADVYETCADRGTSSEGSVTTLIYALRLTRDQFAAGCDLLARASSEAGFDVAMSAPSHPIPAPWEEQRQTPAPPDATTVTPQPTICAGLSKRHLALNAQIRKATRRVKAARTKRGKRSRRADLKSLVAIRRQLANREFEAYC